MKRNCQQNCQQWVLTAGESQASLVTSHIVYGKSPNTLTEKIKPKTLVNGEYSVDGLVLIKQGIEEIKTINFRKKFSRE